MKKLRTFLSLLLSVLMLAAFLLPSAALATDDPTAGGAVDGSKTASPNLLCSAQPQTTVTLSLPSAERHYVYDIVFVMDSSSSTVNSNIDFGVQVKSLCDALIEKDATIKVGVIKCRGRAFDTISLASSGAYSGLVEYSEETSAAILAGIQFTESDLKELSSGTNMHGGLKLADDWLTKDKAVPDSHKFVILLMDGKTYIWNNEADEPTSYYTQYQNSSGPKGTPQVGQQTGAYAKSAYKHKDGYFYNYSTADAHIPGSSCVTVSDMTKCFYTPFYSEIYNSDNAELGDTETKYDSYCYYADKKGSSASGTLTTHTTTNGATFTYNIHKNYYEFVPGINTTYNVDYTGLNWLEAAPYEVINVDGSYSYDFAEPNPDFYQVHPDSLQKALYLTGHLWTDLTAKYNSAAIIYSGWGGGSGLELAKSFDEWILGAEISDYAAELTTAYDPNNPPSDPEEAAAAEAAAIADAAAVGAMFDSISEEILYMIASGTVTDVIPDEFKLVKNGTDTFRMTLNGEALAATADGESAWNFGESVEEKYPYRVEYDEAGKEISWIINVPVENAKPVTLSYDLEIAEDALPGEHDTNVSAVLAYTGSVDESGVSESGEYTFEIPTVTYTGRIQVVKTFEGISEDQVRQLMDKFQINIEPVQDPDAEAGNEPTRGTALEAGDKPADDFTIDPLTLEDAATEDGKTFTWMVEVPVGDYTVSELENSADVAGYTLITEETEDSEPSVTKANVTVTEKNNIENPASAELTNVYEQDIGTLEITKTFDKIPAELIAEDDFVESFEIAVTDAAAEADAAAGNNGDVKPLYTLTLGDQGVKPDDDGLSFKWTLDDVPTGNYTVKENMPESYGGYTLDVVKSNTSVDVTVAKTNGIENPATAKLANVYTQDVGTLTVTKTFEGLEDDEIEALLEEMTIIVTDLEDEDAEPLELELDAQNGKYTASVQLPVGSYNVKESGADVDGYALETTYGNPGADGADNGTAATKREANEPTGADVGDQEPQGITVEVVENEIAEVVVTNTYTPVTGWLVITKEFEGLPEGVIPEKLSFTIAGPEGFGQGGKRTVAYTDFENGEYPIEVPVGTYTITENNTEVEDYFLIQTVEVEAEVEVTEKNTKEAPAVASFLNEYDYGGMGGGGDAKLVIQKVIVGDDVMPAEALFTVTGPKNYTIKYADFADNTYTIEYDVLPGDYTVTESGAEAEGYTLTVTGNNEINRFRRGCR